MNDQELVWLDLARKGSADAFARLVEAYQVPVYNLAYRMLGNSVEAEDAAQETFIRIHTKLHTFQPQRKLSSWVLAIASHHCIDRLRARKGHVVSIDDEMLAEVMASPQRGPEDLALAREEQSEVQSLVEQLAPGYRLALVLHYWYGMPYQEIAGVMQISVQAVKSRLHRARLQIASQCATRQETLISEAT